MRRPLSSRVRQHDTHKELVGRAGTHVAPASPPQLDAIIVPASRHANNLDHAVTLARAARCRLVVLCSHDAVRADVEQFFSSRSFERGVVIDIPRGYSLPGLELSTSLIAKNDLPPACKLYETDLSTKRNIGLLLARMMRWRHIFFLDDDIRDLSWHNLYRTVSMLGEEYSAAGMRVDMYPDNSIVCHAHRETLEHQDVFVSGSSLAVDCRGPIDFFPEIYNEDWLFFYEYAATGKLGTSGLNVTQLRYDPFAEPQRAAWQEFGDVLAEGLYGLLHLNMEATHATLDYWEAFLEARWRFLNAIVSRSSAVHAELQAKILASVDEACGSLAEIRPEFCEYYVRAWLADRESWKQYLTTQPDGLPLDATLERLGLFSLSVGERVEQIDGELFETVLAGRVLLPFTPTFDSFRQASTAVVRRETLVPDIADTMPFPRGFDPALEAESSPTGRGRHRKVQASFLRLGRNSGPMMAARSGVMQEAAE
jgi:hypothetical protein